MSRPRDEHKVNMLQECVVTCDATEHADGSVTITIDVPKRFATLWLMKLAELRTTKAEIDAHSSPRL